MARILEAFRQADSNRVRAPEPPPGPRPASADWEEGLEGPDVPFIEVGGPVGLAESSPDHARAESPAEKVPPRRPVQAVPADEPVALAPGFSDRGPVQVSFRPLPAPATPLGPVCDRFAPELIAFHEPDHPVSEQYRALLAGIEAQLPAGWPQVLLITAPAPRAGTTTVLLNLALTRSLEKGARVAAVDANLTRPAIADRLGLPVAPGLREILQGSISPQRALRQTGLNSFCALTAGQTSDADSTLLGGDPMRALVRYLRGRFDVVFVDAPCWDGHPELVALASLCDAVYLVLPQTASELPEVKDLVQMIPQQGGRLRGCIFTQR